MGSEENSSKAMQEEDLLQSIDGWGRFHKRLMVLIILPILLNGMRIMLVIIVLYVPPHRCRVPGMDNDTYRDQSEWHTRLVKAAIPHTYTEEGQVLYDKCHTYVNPNVTLHINSSLVNSSVLVDTMACDDWVYDDSQFQSTFISQFNLVCDQKDFRANANLAFLFGLMVGAFATGYLCDALGRKPCLFVALAVNIPVGVLMAYPFHPIVFIVCRILTGFAEVTAYMSLYVIVVEVSGPSKRNFASILIAVFWVSGPLLSGCISYGLRDWRHLQLVTVFPAILCLGLWRWIPESPRWLLSKGRVRQARAVIGMIARENGKELSTASVPLTQLAQKQPSPEPPTDGVLQFVKHRTLVVRTCIIFYNWSTVTMTYYGLSLNVSNMVGSVRVNFLLSNAVELVGYCLAWALLDRLGRKRTHCSVMIVAGSACLATIFIVLYLKQEMMWINTALTMVGKMGISAAFSSIYLFSAEQFPTTLRNFGMGCCSTMGKVGSLISPYLADLSLHIEGNFGRILPLIIFGGMAISAGLVSLLLPETLGQKLPDTVEDAVLFGKKKASNNEELQGPTSTQDEEKSHVV